MDPGTALGVASLGIQVCSGLLSYFQQWKGSNSDISAAYDSVDDLKKTFTSLHDFLKKDHLDPEKTARVTECLASCQDALGALEKKLTKLRSRTEPEGFKQKVKWETQRLLYPLQPGVLPKLRATVAEIQTRLQTALHLLQLDVGQTSLEAVKQIEDRITALQESEQYTRLANWLAAPDPWTNYRSALKARADRTGQWLLQSDDYTSWKDGGLKHLWLWGKPGCGKTVLSSIAIEDIKAHCYGKEDHRAAAFFFTFSDQRKQTCEDLLRSLVSQFGWKEPGLTLLQQAFDKSRQHGLSQDDLETILVASLKSFKVVYLMLDALDESPEEGEVRSDMLACLTRLASSVPCLKIFTTSRDVGDVRETLREMRVQQIHAETRLSDGDITKFVSQQLAEDKKLSKLNEDSKELIRSTISQNADGMFRWAYCQLFEIKKLKWMKSDRIKSALKQLPKTLDETYQRMLANIEEADREDAITLLRWLAFAREPLTIAQLAAAASIHLREGGDEIDDCWDEDLAGPLNLLEGLVLVVPDPDEGDANDGSCLSREISEVAESFADSNLGTDLTTEHSSVDDASEASISPESKVRLAHFSVKEYLMSERIKASDVAQFFSSSNLCEEHIAQSCLAYLLHHGQQTRQRSGIDRDFPLLPYAAQWWYVHMSTKDTMDWKRAYALLGTNENKSSWLAQRDPDDYLWYKLEPKPGTGSPLYYASLLGLQNVAKQLLQDGADVNERGGWYDAALTAACGEGHPAIVELLLAQSDVDIYARGRKRSPSSIAAKSGSTAVAELLLADDATVVDPLDEHGWGAPLSWAALKGNSEVVKLLLGAGADANIQDTAGETALHIAAREGHKDIVSQLLEAGADVNAPARHWGNAFFAALEWGHPEIATELAHQGFRYSEIPKDRLGRSGMSVLACYGYFPGLQQILCDPDANIDAVDNQQWTALHWAAYFGQLKAVDYLLHHGASPAKMDWQQWKPVDVARYAGEELVARRLETLAKPSIVLAPGKHHNYWGCHSCSHVSRIMMTQIFACG